ncbi:hypothetical protein [uncultured Endozoicomonas sp.]|nr:hypothetical protein [uncultured Endozoicomonas sp.]
MLRFANHGKHNDRTLFKVVISALLQALTQYLIKQCRESDLLPVHCDYLE